MLTWTSALLLVAPLFLLSYALTHRGVARQEAPLRTILLIYAVCAAAPLAFALFWRLDATRIVIELDAIAFRSDGARQVRKDVRERRPGSGRVVIGDVVQRQRTASPARRFARLDFAPARNGAPLGKLTVELPPPDLRAGLVSTTSGGLLGAQTLEDGDRICVAGSCWTFDADHLSFTAGKRTTRIPPRVAELPGLGWTFRLPFAKPITAGLRTWSLDWLAHDAGIVAADRRVRSFVCHTRGRSELQLVVLDADVSLHRASGAGTPVAKFDVADGERLSFYSLPPQGGGFDAPGIQERRSVVYRAGSRSFVLDLDTPEVHSLRVAELDALRDPHEAKKKVVALAMGDAQMVDRSLYFAGLSDSVAVEASSILELSRYFPRDVASTFRIVSPRGPIRASLGRIQWVGANDAAAIRLDVRRPPLLLLLLGLVLLALKVISAAASRLTLTQVLMAGALEALVGIRLLFGYRTWAMPPHKLEAMELAAVAWMALPWIYLVATMPVPNVRSVRRTGWRGLTASFPPLAGLLLSAAFTARVVHGPSKWVWVVCHFVALGVAALRAEPVQEALVKRWRLAVGSWREKAAQSRWFSRLPPTANRQPPTDAPTARAEPVQEALVNRWRLTVDGWREKTARLRWFSRQPPTANRQPTLPGDPAMNAIIIAAVLFTVVRLVLLLFGFKESANLGVRVSLSVLHIPAAAVLQGLFFVRAWRRVRANQDLGGPDLLAALAILLFVWFIPAGLTSDVGLALLNVPVFALLFLALTRHAAPKRARGRWFARLLVGGIIVVVAGAPLYRLVLPLVASEEGMLSAASDANYARFLHFAAPEQLRALATQRGESLAITSAVLQAYISSGLWGRGYGHSEMSPHLGDTALRDFAPAVFVAAEWGLVGTVAALLLYLAFAIIAQPWLPWQTREREEPRTAPVAAFVAAATICVSSIYMILANHELLLLTGKNAYLLGLDSSGDVIEVIVLVLVIAYGAATGAAERPRTFGGASL